MIEEEELNCQLRLLQGSDKESEKVLTLGEYIGDIEAPAIPASIFLLWARNIAQTFSKELEAGHAIRSWDFHLRLDGSTHLLPYEIKPDTKDSLALTKTTYPVRYCMPLRDNLSDDSANFLSASFVLGSLLYEVVIGAKPYEEVGSEEIRSRYAGNEFPDILSQRLGPIIRGCWMGTYHDTSKVVEDIDSMIGKEASQDWKLKDKLVNYAKDHPFLLGLQVLGTATAIAPLAVVGGPLALVGFGSLGPIGGSLAAGMQASIGAVQAGSAFAFCQSAAMGGAALGSVAAGGAGVATVATAPATVSGLKGWFGRGKARM